MKALIRLLRWLVTAILVFWLGGLLLYRFVDPPATPLMLIRSIERGAWVSYRPVDDAAIAPVLGRAVVASEDSRFCLHHGIDFVAVQDALEDYDETGRLRGASTITMQVARNLFLWPGGGFLRKALEAPLALLLDALWPKRRILAVYLNVAEMGPGLFGAEAAARAHFDRPRLAAILPNPRHWDAGRPSAYVLRRAGIIRARMAQLAREQTACFAGSR
jgi:monofunctional biosynthetic peptidoglycan transglycosylase